MQVSPSACFPAIDSTSFLMFSWVEAVWDCAQRHRQEHKGALLLPGRGSDYIWSINTPWLWEGLCLSLFFFSSFSPIPFVFASLLTTSWHFGHNLSGNLSLMTRFFYLHQSRSRSFCAPIHSFISDIKSTQTVVVLLFMFMPFDPCCRNGVDCSAPAECWIPSSLKNLLSHSYRSLGNQSTSESHTTPRGWLSSDGTASVKSVTEITIQAFMTPSVSHDVDMQMSGPHTVALDLPVIMVIHHTVTVV